MANLIAALVHDVALRENPELIDSVCAAAALTLENERLRAELLAQARGAAGVAARLVGGDGHGAAADRARPARRHAAAARLDRDDSRPRRVEARVGSPAVGPVLHEAREALALALEELRDLTQGIRPAILVERGLPAALDDLSRRAAFPVRLEIGVSGRLPEAVEAAAYFVASEALANAAKHSHASRST